MSKVKYSKKKRKEAIHEIFADGGTEEILEFAKVVESPWKVGYIFGLIADKNIDEQLLPSLLESENKAIAQFIGMFVAGRFRSWEWPWVDEIDTAQWSPSQKGQFLAYLPFIAKTWERSAKFLKEDEAPYWSKTNALPYDAKEDISQAIDYLLKYNRPNEAIRCLDYMIHEKMPFDTQQAVRALLQLLQIPGGEQKLQAYDITEVIKAIQDKPDANPEDLAKIEFAYLPLLDRFHDASPILLERCLADDPAFFCKIIHMVFKSKKKDASVEEYSEKQKEIAHNAFQLLYNWKTPPGSRKERNI